MKHDLSPTSLKTFSFCVKLIVRAKLDLNQVKTGILLANNLTGRKPMTWYSLAFPTRYKTGRNLPSSKKCPVFLTNILWFFHRTKNINFFS